VRGLRILTLFLLLLCAPSAALGQDYSIEDPIPLGATGKVLPLSGKVVELKGLSSGVSGKAEALGAALRDLGAKATKTEIRIELSSDVLFDFDKAVLLPKAIPTLEKVATILQSYPTGACTVEGHTDSIGNDRYNQALSERRADAVKTWLAAHGVTSRMSTRGWGKTKPVAPNTHPNGKDNPEGRQKNRRVEIVVKTG